MGKHTCRARDRAKRDVAPPGCVKVENEGVVMSTPHEASLTDKERAILAGLAAQAEADDPSLAATLRGRARRAAGVSGKFRRVQVPAAVSHWGWGVALASLGLVAMLVALTVSLVIGVVGAVLVFAGVYRVVVAHPGRSRDGGAPVRAPATSDN
jgi:hypothetical protein